MDNTAETGEQNIVNSDSSSTGTDTLNGFPEVTPAPRQSLPKVRKAQMQEQEIAALQAQLRAKEHAEQDMAALQAQLDSTSTRARTRSNTKTGLRDYDSVILTWSLVP